MATPITVQQAPNNAGKVQSFFRKNEFDVTIWNHGYDVIIEKALRCPCKTKGADNLSNCKNCGGSGWVFINPVKTKAILSGQGNQTVFKEWSETNMGNVNISVRDIDRLAFMDRITALDGQTIHTQTAHPNFYKGVVFAFLDYVVKQMHQVFMFHSATEKLLLLTEGIDYQITDSKIILDSKFNEIQDITLSLRYTHAPQYYVIDVKRDVMVATVNDTYTGKRKAQMPISAMGRRAHYVLDRQNFNGDLIYDNSFSIMCVHEEQCNCGCL